MMSRLSKALALISMLKGGTSAPCDEGVTNISVSTLQDASDLQDDLTCSGQGTFYVEWSGQVNIGDLSTDGFAVGNGSSLNVTGSGGSAVIDGGSLVRLFTLTEGSHLYLNSVSLENGKHDNEGGAVSATDSSLLVAVDCSFLNNSATYGGGAIFAANSTVKLHGDTVFEDNQALSGGGISLDGIMAEGTSQGTIRFLRNSASIEGGSAAVYRGAVLRLEGENSIKNNAVLGYNGGGIYVHGGSVYLSGESWLVNNSAADRGGAVYSEYDDIYSVIAISGTSYFENNSAGTSGGGIFTDSTTSLTFENLTYFVDNTAGNGSDGGAAYTRGDSVFGGEVHFRNNSAGGRGGAVNAAGNASFSGEITWYGNVAEFHGGAVYIPDCEEMTFDGDNVFSYNSANGTGGAIYVASCNGMTFNGALQWSHNTAGDDGGAIYAISCTGITFDGTTMEWSHNKVSDDGGAVYIHACNDTIVVGDSVWSHNSAGGEGGALFLDFPDVTTFDGESTWSNNSAGGDGGAMFVNVWTYDTTFNGMSSWSDNYSGGKGGAIFTADEAICFPGESSFENNVASSGEGDDIYPEDMLVTTCEDESGSTRSSGSVGFFSRAVPLMMVFVIPVMSTTALEAVVACLVI